MPHLLLVENHRGLGRSLQCAFNDEGYFITWLQCSDTAREILETNTFDLIIIDSSLPKKSDVRLVQCLRNDYHATPVIILTDNDCRTERRECRKFGAGISFIFSKPFELDEVFKCVEALLLQRSSPLPYLDVQNINAPVQ